MKRERVHTVETIALVVLGSASAAMIVRSIIVIYQNYFIVLFWDQWDLIPNLIRNAATTKSWSYLFKAHNEHVIATSKLLFLLDLALFHLTNWPLVLSTILLAFPIAWLLAVLLFWDRPRSKLFWAVWLSFAASGLSLVQWENLLWGFQPQFYLVLLGALASIIIALKVPSAQGSKSLGWLAALAFAMGFCIFSMGNGIAIPVSVLFLLILFRASWLKCLAAVSFSAIYIGTFFMLTHGSAAVGDPSLKTPYNMGMFFFTMIGSPLNGDMHLAAIAGLSLFFALSALFASYLVVPWIWRRPIDPGLAGLFALVGFLLATAAAAAWARTSLGVGAAMASRYATPMLLLWMSVCAVLMRISFVTKTQTLITQGLLWLSLAATFWTAAGSSLRPDVVYTIGERARAINQAAYFVASGVLSPPELALLYPDSHLLRTAISFLRVHRLNIFADRMGPLGLRRNKSLNVLIAKLLPVCALGFVAQAIRLGSNSWEVKGWASDARQRTPRWILATDRAGRLLGYTAPVVPRPDVERAIGAHHFRGFVLPLQISDSTSGPYSVIGLFDGQNDACWLALPLHY